MSGWPTVSANANRIMQNAFGEPVAYQPMAGGAAVGDPISIIIIRRLRERGLGILVTDHNVRETLKLVDRAYLVHHGRIVYSGIGAEMPNDPQAREIYLGPEFNL